MIGCVFDLSDIANHKFPFLQGWPSPLPHPHVHSSLIGKVILILSYTCTRTFLLLINYIINTFHPPICLDRKRKSSAFFKERANIYTKQLKRVGNSLIGFSRDSLVFCEQKMGKTVKNILKIIFFPAICSNHERITNIDLF